MMDNCSAREIAEALQISEAAVKSRLSRARARLDPACAAGGSQWNAHSRQRLDEVGKTAVSGFNQ